MAKAPATAEDSCQRLGNALCLRAYPRSAQERRLGNWIYFAHKFRNETVSFLNTRRRMRGRWLHQHPALALDGLPDELAGPDVNACSKWLTSRLEVARAAVATNLGLKPSKQTTVKAVSRAFLSLTRAEQREIPDGWLLTVPRTVFDQVLQDLGRTVAKAIADRSARKKPGRSGKTARLAGFPQHHKWRYPGSIRVQVDAARNRSVRDHWAAGRIFIPGLGYLKFRDRQALPSTPPSLITVSRSGSGAWHVSFACAPGEGKAAHQHQRLLTQPLPIDPKTGLPRTEALDFGTANRTTDTSGKATGRAKYLRRQLAALRHANKALARKRKGSGRWVKAARKAAALHESIARERRADVLACAREVVSQNAIVCLEDLLLAFMLQNRRTSRAAYDTGLGLLAQAIARECEKHGHLLLRCHRFDPSSKRCAQCHTKNQSLKLSDPRTWTCSSCGQTHDRDHNAALNIRQMALARAIATIQKAPETGARSLSPHRLKPALEGFIARGGLASLLAFYQARISQPREACTLPTLPLESCLEQARVG